MKDCQARWIARHPVYHRNKMRLYRGGKVMILGVWVKWKYLARTETR